MHLILVKMEENVKTLSTYTDAIALAIRVHDVLKVNVLKRASYLISF